jgi:acetylornithine/succinyldiaminopimelate/putrescine aminotransferase
MLVEPVQGEGGIRVLDEHTARALQNTCRAAGCPIVVDEIQSGMGRTGAFLASSHLGLRGDYYAMAKSLGGGIAKAAVMLVRASRYQTSFEMMHSSTFAKDSFSCLIAGKVLEMLEADDGEVYRAVRSRGEELRSALRGLQQEFPEVLQDVRGRGLMVGLEFAEQGDADSATLRELHASGFFGYFLSGYLLREHGIRTFPTSSAVYTLRFEPSAYIGAADIARLTEALRELCRQIRDTDGRRLAPIG